ncbi:MAG TPA: DEAD/DEAH box helicase [Verrucomicrobia bacterium]|nr:DEAD/DEAH box helicase [Verrucomicrobiota bacterium]HOP96682.1 DEAD/DEAH box helicase [Verrucomicrobiota bacterium]HPU55956.1 DEAD/DEAH box helicase [Verrucomicrobiota bacterium]
MSTLASQLTDHPALNQVTVPDLWQQQAVSALREGKDVVVHAPTGAGKTLIFELWSNQGKNRGQAIYTVPTRALANDKLAEWRARGWDVGIATGDLAENLSAPILVATLETQKNRLIQGDGPTLLVVDEYQMIRDEDRGLNYELAIAMAPERTQLLLLSGSVANPEDVVKWLTRLGRDAVLIRHNQRPVPLEEVHAAQLNWHVPPEIKGYWARLAAKSLAEDLGPLLIFAPRRQAAESMAADLARQLPNPNPLTLSPEQKLIVGEHLARLLKSRIAYHHSGLSYAARAGVIEPLAKAGQLRVVVATMGLAAGINFSLRSVALAGDSYRRDAVEHPLRPDEILQMFGRAGRRGLDETGFVLITANELRLLDARPCHLSRSGAVDWSALLGLMAGAAHQRRDPFTEAVRVQERLFTVKPIFLGVEESLKHPEVPCGLKTDAERARHVRKLVREMRNSRGEWQPLPAPTEVPIGRIVIPIRSPAPDARHPASETARGHDAPQGEPRFRPLLSEPAALEKIGSGHLVVLHEENGLRIYGRAVTVADRLNDDRVIIAKWVRRLTNWNGRQAPTKVWEERIAPLVERRLAAQKTPVVRYVNHGQRIQAHLSLAELPMRVPVDQYGVAIWRPVAREVLPYDCAQCSLVPVCKKLPTATGTALLWRRLGLIDAAGTPTLRGRVVSFFSQGDGLAIAAALEDESYPIDELVYDLANLEAGFRFCGDDNRWGGRLAAACHAKYGLQNIPGYLENGVPPKYGAGAEQIVASVHQNPLNKQAWATDLVGVGDIDRIIIEWRSLLRQISHAPDLEWPRWRALQAMAKTILNETESPTLTDLPPLEYHQTRRVEHRLILRRH